MAPSEKAINDAIKSIVADMWFGAEKHDISVTNVRAKVEKQFKLENGSLKTAASWDKIKSSIKSEATKYIDAEEAGNPIVRPKPEPPASPVASRPAPAKKQTKAEPAKKGTKRSSNGEKQPPKKRQKKAATPSDDEDSDSPLSAAEDTAEESELSDFSEAPKPKKAKKSSAKPTPAPKRPQQKKPEPKNEEIEEDPESYVTVAAPKNKTTKKQTSDEESELSDLKDEEPDIGPKPQATAKLDGNDSDSDMSVLIDEGPKPKKSRKSNSSEKTSKPKPSSASKTKAPAELSPDEAEIKTLQSHLTKCGIRKIWGMELKKYGDDKKGKIRHLKSMLREAGMDGRFSEAKAREIREARELKAELEAVVEGEQHWGMGRGGRSKKSKSKGKDVESGSEEEEEEDAPPPRVPRAKMDLAFLGDESESD